MILMMPWLGLFHLNKRTWVGELFGRPSPWILISAERPPWIVISVVPTSLDFNFGGAHFPRILIFF